MNLYAIPLLVCLLKVYEGGLPPKGIDECKVAGNYTRPHEDWTSGLVPNLVPNCTYGQAHTIMMQDYLYLLDDGSFTMGCIATEYDNINHTSAAIGYGSFFFKNGFWRITGHDTLELENTTHQQVGRFWRKDCHTLKELPLPPLPPGSAGILKLMRSGESMTHNSDFTRKDIAGSK
jgi:hypothetical protein